MLAYYAGAFSRSWMAAWEWATGQGIFLTWLLGFGVLICAIGFAMFRAIGKHHSWNDAINDARKAVQDFFLAMVVASIFVLALLFVVFFVKDAPRQIALAENTIKSLKTENAQTIEQLKKENAKTVDQLKADIANLQSKLDNQETQRRERLEQLRVRNERINVLAEIITDGNQIAKTFEEKDDKDLIQSQYRAWEQRTLEVLLNKFDVSYLSQFGSTRGTGFVLMNHNYEGNGWCSLLQGKLNVLNTFLAEARKQ
jgi:hypothetical protein